MIPQFYVFWSCMKTGFLIIAIADILSQKIMVGSRAFCCKSLRTLLNHTNWQTTSFAAIYSTSAENKVIEFCFFEQQEIIFVTK